MALQAAIIFTSIRSVPIESIFSVLKDDVLPNIDSLAVWKLSFNVLSYNARQPLAVL